MVAYAQQNPFELWTTHELLGVFRDEKPEDWYFGQFFTNQMRSTDEWIDFEKLPIRGRKLAPFVRPMGRGHGVFTDTATGYRFKPAYLVMEDSVDPLRPLTYQPGIDRSMYHPTGQISPLERLELIKMNMLGEMVLATQRRWEWMKARAIIDGAVTCTYRDGTVAVLDFNRAGSHTVTLTAGNRWGDSVVSILDSIQLYVNRMNNASFGGMTTRITMGGVIGEIVRKDAEIVKHLDRFVEGGTVTVVRGVVAGANGGGKIYKIGELMVGGASGQKIELWVNNETYTADDGTEVRYLAQNEVVFTSTPSAINGYECFGRIVDKDAGYEAIPLFPKNYETGERVKVENISVESAPLMVPINPNATLKVTMQGL